MSDTTGNTERTGPRSELRLAVTFTGGVSLAVWMGGIAREMDLLLAARNAGTSSAVPAKYKKLLDLLRLDVSIDVLSGTSAGGINAAFLGLANAHGCDLGGLRDLWLDQGSLGLLSDTPDWQLAVERSQPRDLPGFDDGVALLDLPAALPDERREAFVLTQVVGLPYAEAAEAADCPVGTVRSPGGPRPRDPAGPARRPRNRTRTGRRATVPRPGLRCCRGVFAPAPAQRRRPARRRARTAGPGCGRRPRCRR
jgi:hypothetical protein